MVKPKILLIIISLTTLLIAQSEPSEDIYNLEIEQLLKIPVQVGTRTDGNISLESMSPVDIITHDQIASSGRLTLGEVLEYFLPEFNYPHPSVADGTDHVRPGTLIGLNPDHVLLLINGKRIPHSALLHINNTVGRGTTSPDYSLIPIEVIERIEFLKDGSSAQYGTDAIAGIINIILKDNFENNAQLMFSETSEKDGQVKAFSFSSQVLNSPEVTSNFYFRYHDRQNTNRAGFDPRDQYFPGDPRNDAYFLNRPITHRFGDAEAKDFLVLFTWDQHLSENANLFAMAKVSYRKGESAGFFRRPADDRNVRSIYPNGFLPLIKPDIRDVYLIGELTRANLNGWKLIISSSVAQNKFSFNVGNSLNTSFGSISPLEFYCGSLEYTEYNTNIDIINSSLPFLTKGNIAMGSELRIQGFKINPGNPASYSDGGIPILDGPHAGQKASIGAQVFPGFRPDNATDEKRMAFSLYSDLEAQVVPSLKLGISGRFESYSDFGTTINGKLQSNWNPFKKLHLRFSAGTGFRAPSLQQSLYSSYATAWINNTLQDIGTFPVDHPLSRNLGAKPLQPEKSSRINLGLICQPNTHTLFELNVFRLYLDDRIILSKEIEQDSALYGNEIVGILRQFNVYGARYFTNAVNTVTNGFNAKIAVHFQVNQFNTSLELKHQYNETEIDGSIYSPPIIKQSGTDILDNDETVRLTGYQPKEVTHIHLGIQNSGIHFMTKFIRYSSYYSSLKSNLKINPQWICHSNIALKLVSWMKTIIGVNNVFNVCPEKDSDPNLVTTIFPYPLNSPYGFNGRRWFVSLNFAL
ncbi:MAG: TonB-dependent receptor [Calditrichia bacterium]